MKTTLNLPATTKTKHSYHHMFLTSTLMSAALAGVTQSAQQAVATARFLSQVMKAQEEHGENPYVILNPTFCKHDL